VFWPLLSNSKHSGVSEDSKSPTLGVGVSSSHLAQSGVAIGCLLSLSLRQCCEGFTCLFTRNDLVEMGCLLALLLMQRCEGFTFLFMKHDLGAKCFAFSARVLH
jgi:hypothetical protein